MQRIRTAIAALATSFTAIALVSASIPGGELGEEIPGTAGGTTDGTIGDVRAVSTVGKIITEHRDGQTGVCSGAIVDSPSGSVIATAAHCVRAPDIPGAPLRGWFVPGYDHDGLAEAMEAGWRIASYHTPPGWDVTRRLEKILPHDYAFVTVERKGGRTIQETHGANTLAFAPVDSRQPVAPLGYPAAPPYDGESLSSCAGTAELLTEDTAHESNVGGLLLERCELTQGASGGPWLQDFDEASQSGTVVGVMSVGSGEGQVLGRPYPATEGRALLARAAAADAAG